MSTAGRRGLIRAVALAAAAAALAGAAAAAVAVGTHSSPAAHHALADNGVISTN